MYPTTLPTSSLIPIQFLSLRRTSPFHKTYRYLQPPSSLALLLTHTFPLPPSTRCQRPRQARPLFSPKSLRSHHDRRHRPPPDDSVQENLNPLLERNLRTVACLIASSLFFLLPHSPSSSVRDSSKILIQVFDQRKFKRNDQGCLGSVSITVGDVLNSDQGSHGIVLFSLSPLLFHPSHTYIPHHF
jgi:hypothetical protein